MIYDELVRDVVRPESRDAYLGVVDRLAQRGADAVILGCTEIGLLLGPGDGVLPQYDTTQIHADAGGGSCSTELGSHASSRASARRSASSATFDRWRSSVDVSRTQEARSRAARSRAGSGFDEYVLARGPELVRTAYLLTGDHGRAEDLVQTALAKVWPRWDSIAQRTDVAPHAYVRKVMLTTYIAWWRRRWNGEVPTDHLPEGDHGALADRVAAAPRHHERAGLADASQRAVVVLRYFEDLTEVQTAEALNCSVGNVKSQCSRALRALRLSPHLADGGASS